MSKLFFLLLTLAFALQPVLARSETSQEVPVPEELKEYRLAGETRTCLPLRSIRDTDVLDDYHILFETRGGDIYLNKLSHRCSRLGFEKSFTYSTSQSSLCRNEIISVLDNNLLNRTGGLGGLGGFGPGFVGGRLAGLGVGPSCGLEEFVKLEPLGEDDDPAAAYPAAGGPSEEAEQDEDGNWYVPPETGGDQ